MSNNFINQIGKSTHSIVKLKSQIFEFLTNLTWKVFLCERRFAGCNDGFFDY